MADYTVSRDVAKKVLKTVDAGLVAGIGDPKPGQMCVEAAVCYAMGLPHGDDPACVSRALRSYKIGLNDATWSSPQARAKGMRRLALAQLGSRDTIDDVELVKALAKEAQEYSVPLARKYAAEAAAMAAANAAMAAAYAADAAAAAARDAAYAAYTAARGAADAADAADAARAAAARGAADAAAADAAGDKVLADHAERAVQILLHMNAPGCAFLDLAPLE